MAKKKGKRARKITDEQREQYRKIDPFWGTQMPCWTCGRCGCEARHPNGPCVPKKKEA